MAVPAIDSQFSRMESMGIRDRLNRRVTDIGRRRRAAVPYEQDQKDGKAEGQRRYERLHVVYPSREDIRTLQVLFHGGSRTISSAAARLQATETGLFQPFESLDVTSGT
jgi:hypothetical protein